MTWGFRPVEASDSESILAWRNDPQIYRYLFNPFPVDKNTHVQWLEKVLANEHTVFLMASFDGSQCGTVKFDFNQNFTEAEVGIYLVPQMHGQGHSVSMLTSSESIVRKKYKGLKKIIARVLTENHASEKMFLKSGYSKKIIQLEKSFEVSHDLEK